MSEAEASGNYDCGIAVIRVEDVSRQINSLESEAHQQSALNIAIRFNNSRALRDEAEAKPVNRRQGQLGFR